MAEKFYKRAPLFPGEEALAVKDNYPKCSNIPWLCLEVGCAIQCEGFNILLIISWKTLGNNCWPLGLVSFLLQPNPLILSIKKVLSHTYLCDWRAFLWERAREDLIWSPLKQLIWVGTQLLYPCLSREHNCKQSLSGTIWLPWVRKTAKSILLKAEWYPLEITKQYHFSDV